MSNLNRHPVRRAAAGVLAGALALSGGALVAAPSAFAAPGFQLDRIAGADRYDTSAQTALEFGASTNVILASGENGRAADALGASFLAGVRSAPVLLTAQAALPATTRAALTTMRARGASTVTIVGGTAAVSDAVLAEVRALGFTVDRLSGADRYRTAEAVVAAGEGPTASNVGIVASGLSTVDALAAGPLAYKGKHPVFLTTAASVPATTIAAMRAAGVTQVYIVGGTTVVSAEAQAQLTAAGITVLNRLAGVDRSATSVAIANAIIENFGFTNTTFNVASGANNGVDALSGAALSGKQNRAILITNTATNAGAVTAFATARANTLNAAGVIFGGTAAVSADVEAAIEAAGAAGANFQTLAVSPSEAATLQVVRDAADGTDDDDDSDAAERADNRMYTVTGLNDATRYRITLVNAANVQGTGAGQTFRSSAIAGATGRFAVDVGTDIADIVRVNGGTPLNNGNALDSEARTATANPVNGSLTFEIDGTAPGTVVPVVYVDGGQGGTATTGGSDNRLETSATAADTFAAVTETYGVGGPTTYVNPAATSQVLGQTDVEQVNKASNTFDANGVTFSYDANDTFSIATAAAPQVFLPATLEEFETALSSGDLVNATYSATAGASSSFQLVDSNPPAPSSVTAQAGTEGNTNDITVTVNFTANTPVDSVIIQRATVTGSDLTDEGTTGTVGTYATVTTITPTAAQIAAGAVTFVDNDVPVGFYRYQAALVNDGDQSPFEGDDANEASTAPAADTTQPTATDARLTADNGFAGLLDAGDVFVVRFNEALAAPAAGATIRVRDDEDSDSVADLVNGTNATFALNAAAIPATPTTNPNAGAPAGTVLTVTLTGAPAVITPGTAAGIDLPATIVNTLGINDAAGNRLNLAGSTDLIIDMESATDTTSPTISNAQATNATTVVVTTDETVSVFGGGSVVDTNFFYDVDGTGGGAAVRATAATLTNGTTITLTFPADTVSITANAADLLTYTDANPDPEAGDPVDAAGNQLANETGEPVDDVV